ncbi:MAG: hypothetical protein JXA44_11365 [Methanospirillaceae archaeon]|nr:hypothetical protein [Methanospirillaceae archaeon]
MISKTNTHGYPPMKITKAVFLCILVMVWCTTPGLADVFLRDGKVISGDAIFEIFTNTPAMKSEQPFPIYFFYTSSCGSCKDAREYLLSFERKNPSIPIEYRNLAFNGENRALFTPFKKEFHRPDISYPAVFIGNIGIAGSSDIIHHTDQIAKAYLNRS